MMAARDCIQIREVLLDLGLLAPGASVVRSDNKSVIDLSLDAIAFKKTKHIMRAAEFLRDLCLRNVLTVCWISGENNPADIFTKHLTREEFERYMCIVYNCSLEQLRAIARDDRPRPIGTRSGGGVTAPAPAPGR